MRGTPVNRIREWVYVYGTSVCECKCTRRARYLYVRGWGISKCTARGTRDERDVAESNVSTLSQTAAAVLICEI